MADLTITKGATSIVLPDFERQYSQGWIDFEVSERTINRTLVSDFVAFKRTFTISWPILSEETLAALLEWYLDKEDVTFTETQSDSSTLSWTCRISISDSILREIEAVDYAFSGFSITLEEV
jgi:hypothetical protein